ncbi:unnamed protein product, partial [Leptidea sinapis]
MGKIINRRSRTPNWSLEEKQYLLDLIKDHKEVVVNKNSNGPNHCEEKDAAWSEILRELEAKFGNKFSTFTIKKVKTQWQNMKRIAREEITLNGSDVNNYTRQSLEVCNILELVKDGVLKKESETENDNERNISTNIEIKTECIDESDMSQPSCSGMNTFSMDTDQNVNVLDSSSSSLSINTNIMETVNIDEDITEHSVKKAAHTMTESLVNFDDLNMLPKEFREYLRYSSSEKELKIESLKEERLIVKAMRETAELNKIIAEQKLKHLLWMKKQEM